MANNLTITIQIKDLISRSLTSITAGFKRLATAGLAAAQVQVSRLANGLNNLQRAFFSLKGILATIGIGAVVKSFISAGNTAESLRVRLSTLAGSVQEGNRLFNDMAKLASRVPQTFEDIIESATRLIGVVQGGVDDVNRLMPLILDLSTATGLKVDEVTAQVIRMWSAGAAAADMFRERGVLAMLGFRAATDYNVTKTRQMLMEAWEGPTSKFRDASKSLATTFRGIMSMLQDAWFQFRVAVMDSGAMDFLKGFFAVILDDVRSLKDDTKAYGELVAKVSSGIISAFKAVAYSVAAVIDAGRGLAMIVSGLGYAFSAFAEGGAALFQRIQVGVEGLKLGFTSLMYVFAETGVWFNKMLYDVVNGLGKMMASLRDFMTAANEFGGPVDLFLDSGIQKLTEYTNKTLHLAGNIKDAGRVATEYWKDATLQQEQALLKANEALEDSPLVKFWTNNREALGEYLKELGTTLPAVQRVSDIFEQVDEKITSLQQDRIKAEREIRERQLKLQPEAFSFTEAEESARRASMGVLELREATIALEKQHDSGLVSLREYYKRREELQNKQYAVEVDSRLRALEVIEEAELDRVAETQKKIQEVKEQVATGQRSSEDVVTQNLLKSLEVQKSASREYLEGRRKVEEEIYKLRLDHEDKIVSLTAQKAKEIERVEQEQSDARLKIQKHHADTRMKIVETLVDGSVKIEAKLNAQREQEIVNHEERLQEIAELTNSAYEDDLQRQVEFNRLKEQEEARHQATLAGIEREAEDAKAQANEERRKTNLGKAVDANADGVTTISEQWAGIERQMEEIRLAGGSLLESQLYMFRAISDIAATEIGKAGDAFKDMYDATGQKSKEFFYAWKAMQIAETIISTYTGAQKAYQAYADIPYVGPALGGVAAALAVAQGLARVALIRSQSLAVGGEVGGTSPTATADNIPAMLTAGEFVHPVKTVKHYGVGIMEAIRQRAIPKDALSRFSLGGLAPAPSSLRFAQGGSIPTVKQADRQTEQQPININNIIDPQVMEQYVASKPGERMIMNVMTKNQFQLRQIMNQGR